MNVIETPLYPYRVTMKSAHSHKIYLPEVDFEKVADMIFNMKKDGKILNTVFFSSALKIIKIALDTSDIQGIESPYDEAPMRIKDLNGKYEVIVNVQRNEKPKKVVKNPSVAQTVKKRIK